MAELQMPPQYTGEPEYPDPKDTEGHVAAAAAALAKDRVGPWMTSAAIAIDQFETNANRRIEELEFEGDVTFDCNPILVSFTKIFTSFPVFEEIKDGLTDIYEVMESIQSSREGDLKSELAAGKNRLRDSVTTLTDAARDHLTKVTPLMRNHMPEAVENAMTWVDSASTAPEYVSALCDWMGFPEPTPENTVYPIRQALENPFFGVYQSVRCRLLRAQGVAGLSDDDLNPITWEHDGVETQRELYGERGKAAWEASYERSLPERFNP